ncbi:MAG: TRAP transporter small permease [Bacillota bacterium]|jgi:TRAP-type C4-dicarboxylate transport system permease small subunit|nr:TRAP transporter small permease [Bacillota bacterium]
MKALNRVNKTIATIISWIAGILLAVMVFVTFWQVIVRLLRSSLPWSEEVARYMQVYLTFLGVSVGVRLEELVAVEAVYEKTPKIVQKVINIFVYLVIGIVSLLLIRYGWSIAKVTMMQSAPVTGIKMGYVYGAILVGSLLIFFHNAVNAINYLTGWSDPDEKQAPVNRIEAQG